VALLLAVPIAAQEAAIETFVVRNRPAEDLVIVLRPLVGSNGSVTAFAGKLIVKAEPAALAQVRQLLPQLDVPPRALWITVRSLSEATGQDRAAAISGAVRAGDATVTQPGTVETRQGTRLERRTTHTSVTGAFAQGSSESSNEGTFRIQAVEGRPAFIRAGAAVPTAGVGVVQPAPGAAPVVVGGAAYQDVVSGFYATPRVSGDLLVLEISTLGDAIDSGGRIEIRRIRTTVSGRLGEWLHVGGLEIDDRQADSALLARSEVLRRNTLSVDLKVDEVH